MGKYSKIDPNDKRKKRVLQIVVGFLSAVLAILILVFGFVWSKLGLIQYEEDDPRVDYQIDLSEPFSDGEEYVVNVEGLETVNTAPVISDSEIFDEDHIFNILILGTDERTEEFNTNARSDCMILVSIDKDANTVKLVSLERGIAVPILEGQYEGEYDILTHIFRYGGSELVTKTVEHCFRVDVDHYVRFNFHSVREAVNAIGGIEMELTQAEAFAINKGKNRDGVIRTALQEGVNHLDGFLALDFARLRSIDSDWRRVERQRKVILAVVDKLKGSSLLTLNDLADTVLPLIQTNLTKMEIAELILYAPNFMEAEFDQLTIPQRGSYGKMGIIGGKGGFAIDYDVNLPLLHGFLFGEDAQIQ